MEQVRINKKKKISKQGGDNRGIVAANGNAKKVKRQ